MSEYQYYEFQALDRPLTQREMRELRKYSTRATITDTRFVNHYEWGNFKGDTSVWMRKYFDAFLYCANWGTHRLMLRLPSGALDVKTAKRYLGTRSVTAHRKDNIVILDFSADDDSGNWADDSDGSGLLSSLIALRAEIAAGDHRALYLGWLSAALRGDLRDKEVEPPVPPGMATLSAPLKALADFLYVSADLIQVAAERSQPNFSASCSPIPPPCPCRSLYFQWAAMPRSATRCMSCVRIWILMRSRPGPMTVVWSDWYMFGFGSAM